jgi:hypothetical protein
MRKPALILATFASFTSFAAAPKPDPSPWPSVPTVVETGPHHRVWEWASTEAGPDGQETVAPHTYTELATGLHYWNQPTSRWEESVAAYEMHGEGQAVAERGQHRVTISGNLTRPGAVDLRLPDGQHLRSQPMGLSYFDTATGQNLLLAAVKDCVGELTAPNVILFADAFDTLKADIRYRYTLDGFEQDVILRQDPGSPADYGLDPDTTRLELYTEFFDPPSPTKETLRVGGGLEDERLDFGPMQIGRGVAYFTPGEVAPVEVVKAWQKLQGRDFLIEGLPYLAARPLLDQLQARVSPPATGELARRTARGRSGLAALLPRRQVASLLARVQPASRAVHSPGVVLDYVIVNGTLSNYLFKGDTTYYLSGNTTLGGTSNVFEGGTVIKYAPAVSLTVNTPLVWQGAPYRPVVLTSRDDNTVGETVSGSTGDPYAGYGAATALVLGTGTSGALAYARIAHAQTAISLSAGSGWVFSHAQVVHCQTGISASGGVQFKLRNALFDHALTGLSGSSATARIEHLTVDTANVLNSGLTVYLTNSLVGGVASLGSLAATSTVAVVSNPSGLFQALRGGYHYLAAASPYRDHSLASTNLDPTLLAELRQRTTYPPVELTGDFTNSTVLGPVVQRDVDTLDLGYHYDSLDYCWSGRNLTNATLTLTNGVAVGVFGTRGTTLRTGAKVLSEGWPDRLNPVVRCNTVQEQSLAWGTPSSLFDVNTSSGPELRLRFTDVSLLADSLSRRYLVLNSGKVMNPLAVSDSCLRGVYLDLYALAPGLTVTLTNNVWDRPRLSFYQADGAGYYAFNLRAYHNLFYTGALTFSDPYESLTWTVQDNLFDCDTLSGCKMVASHNGYRSGLTSLGGTGNKTGLVPDYQGGPLGRFYYPASGGSTSLATLRNAGSRTASAAGLYHHTVTLDQAKEAGTQADIGFHYVAVDAQGQPLDSDTDGLPDYLEDRNGNGALDTGETDPANPDTNEDGLLDGEGYVDPPALFTRSYTCQAVRDFTCANRSREYPDATFDMNWGFNQPGSATNRGQYAECNPPATPYGVLLTQYTWASVGDAAKKTWNEVSGWTDLGTVPRPPSEQFDVPWEYCVGYPPFQMTPPEYPPPFLGQYTRTAQSGVSAYTGGRAHPKPTRAILLQLSLIDKRSGATLDPDKPGHELAEPDNRWVGPPISPVDLYVSVGNERVDANGQVLLTLPKNSRVDVTPHVADVDYSWYQFSLTLPEVRQIRLTWSRHPQVSIGDQLLHQAFDAGARKLATDDDERIPDDDPSVTPGNPAYSEQTYRHDDAPAYLEFIIPKAKRGLFPAAFLGEDYTLTNYLDIRDVGDLERLRQATFANVKVVKSIRIGGWAPMGYGVSDCQPGMFLTETGANNELAPVHESGHVAGLLHRGDTLVTNLCDVPNPVVLTNDFDALMNSNDEDCGDEVNRHERNIFEQWDPGLWND